MRYSHVIAAVLMWSSLAHAQQPVYAARPIEGYVCKSLNITEAQALDPRAPGIPILLKPDPAAQVGTTAAAVVFAKEPAHIVNGYAEVLQFTGLPGWIEADKIVPYHSASNPYARCRPAVLSNGRIGMG